MASGEISAGASPIITRTAQLLSEEGNVTGRLEWCTHVCVYSAHVAHYVIYTKGMGVNNELCIGSSRKWRCQLRRPRRRWWRHLDEREKQFCHIVLFCRNQMPLSFGSSGCSTYQNLFSFLYILRNTVPGELLNGTFGSRCCWSRGI